MGSALERSRAVVAGVDADSVVAATGAVVSDVEVWRALAARIAERASIVERSDRAKVGCAEVGLPVADEVSVCVVSADLAGSLSEVSEIAVERIGATGNAGVVSDAASDGRKEDGADGAVNGVESPGA
jgi:hypothetical protein